MHKQPDLTGRPVRGRRQGGFGLVEILISVAIGLVVLAAIGQVYVGSNQTYRVTEALSRLQENGRLAVAELAREMRMAGYMSCGGANAAVANAVDGGGSWLYRTAPIAGLDGGVDTFPDEFKNLVVAQSDALILRHADTDGAYYVTAHNPASATIHLGADHDLKQGEVIVIANADCTQLGVFQMTNTNSNNTIDVVNHATGAAVAPGNCTKALWTDFDCSGSVPTQTDLANHLTEWSYKDGSTLFRFASHAYYVGWKDAADRAAGVAPGLIRAGLGPAGAVEYLPLVEGVESMQIRYGENTDGDAQRTADIYVTANNVTNWDNVVAVRLTLLLRSAADNVREDTDIGTYQLFERVVDPVDDRRLRRRFTVSTALRNGLP